MCQIKASVRVHHTFSYAPINISMTERHSESEFLPSVHYVYCLLFLESEIESLMNGVFGSEQAHVDWKVLGLMLGLSDSTLEKIQSRTPEDGFEKAMLRHWIELGRAYCSVLVHVLAGPVIDERGVARDNAKTFLG